MPKKAHSKVDFKDPPVVEVALGLQFKPLSRLKNPHLGLLWAKYRKSMPVLEELAPRPSATEDFDAPRLTSPEVQIKILGTPIGSRCWFLNGDGTELIQVQPDRFVFNWRKRQTAEEYPRYEYVKERFREHFHTFTRFLSREELGDVEPNQCEVSYINHIFAGAGWSTLDQAGRVFAQWKQRYDVDFLPKPETVQFETAYQIPGDDDEPIGRLHARMDSGYSESEVPMFRFRLTARGRPYEESVEGAFRFFDVGREWIVQGFDCLTTARMHEIWGKRHGA